MRPLSEQTILVTGATDGLGRELAAELAAQGATVLVHGRDRHRGEHTLSEIRASTRSDKLQYLEADLSSLDETRALAGEVRERFDVLHALVNNAGIGTANPGVGATNAGRDGRVESGDGYELRFAVNYLAGYVLTRELIGLLEQSAPSRIVNVSSAGQAPIDFEDVMLERSYSGVRAYCQSKLAQVCFTFDLAEELAETGVTANCLHPASYMPTKMVHAAGIEPISALEEGVHATMRLIADPELDGISGRYYNGLEPANPHPQALDRDARRRLRELSARLTSQTRSAR
jgi:NAD(P)-dependent dehydrogenase (short-subunit alcohol dehydrogenase family)